MLPGHVLLLLLIACPATFSIYARYDASVVRPSVPHHVTGSSSHHHQPEQNQQPPVHPGRDPDPARCPPGVTGQFHYPPDCKKFLNCWKGRGALQVCAPGTLFNPHSRECDHPSKVRCMDVDGYQSDGGGQIPMPLPSTYVRFPNGRPAIQPNSNKGRDSRIINRPNQVDHDSDNSNERATKSQITQSKTTQQRQRVVQLVQCQPGATGHFPHPHDCRKFLHCWDGRTFEKECGPGTAFNPAISVCDHIHNVRSCGAQPTRGDKSDDSDEVQVIPSEYVRTMVKPPERQPEDNEGDSDSQEENYDPYTNTYIPSNGSGGRKFPGSGTATPTKNPGTKDQRQSDLDSEEFPAGTNPLAVTAAPEYGWQTPPSNGYRPRTPISNDSQLGGNERPGWINPGTKTPAKRPPSGSKIPPRNEAGHQPSSEGNKPLQSSNETNAGKEDQYGPKENPTVPKLRPVVRFDIYGNPIAIEYAPVRGYYPDHHPYHPVRNHKFEHNHPYHPMHHHNHPFGQNPDHPIHNPNHHMHDPKHLFVHDPNHPMHNRNHPIYNPSSSPSRSFLHDPNHPMHHAHHPPPSRSFVHDPNHSIHFHNNNSTTSNSNLPYPYDYQSPNPAFPGSPNSNQQNKPHSNGSGFNQPEIKPNNPLSQTKPSDPYSPPSYQPYYPNNRPQPDQPFSPNSSNFNPPNPGNFNLPDYPNIQQVPSSPFPANQETPSNPSIPKQYQPYYPNPNGPQYPNVPNPNQPAGENSNFPNPTNHPSNIPYYPYQPNANFPYPTPLLYPMPNTTFYPHTNIPLDPGFSPHFWTNPMLRPNSSVLYPFLPPNYPNNPDPNFKLRVPGTLDPNDPYNNPDHPQFDPNISDPRFNKNNTNQQHPQNLNPDSTKRPNNSGTKNPFTSTQNKPQPNAYQPGKFDPTSRYPPKNVTYPDNPYNLPRPGFPTTNPVTGQDEASSNTNSFPPSVGSQYDSSNSPARTNNNWPNPWGPDANPLSSNSQHPYGNPTYNPQNPQNPYNHNNFPWDQTSNGSPSNPNIPKPSTQYPNPNLQNPNPNSSQNPQIVPNVNPNRPDYQFPSPNPDGQKFEDLGQSFLDVPDTGEVIPQSEPDSILLKITKGGTKKPAKSDNSSPNNDYERLGTRMLELNDTKPEVKPSPPSGQNVRIRGGSGVLDGYLEVRKPNGRWGIVCDEPNGWTIDEASIVCTELGYARGAELSWQGYPMVAGSEDSHVSVDKIKCGGDGTFEETCMVTFANKSKCQIGKNAVGLRCYNNIVSTCQPGEVHLGDSCYSLTPTNATGPGLNLFESAAKCERRGGHLLDLNTQAENDFISEWLVQSHANVSAVMTSGVGITVMGLPMWVWQGTDAPMLFQKWWTGWSGNDAPSQGRMHQPACLVMRRKFPCPVKNPEDREEVDETRDMLKKSITPSCITDYFFWDSVPCNELKAQNLPYICERPVSDVGCVEGRGETYSGPANTTASGKPCLSWDHQKVLEGFSRRRQTKPESLTGHNFCRNVGQPDHHPWCFIAGSENSEYCDIPHCYATGTDNDAVE